MTAITHFSYNYNYTTWHTTLTSTQAPHIITNIRHFSYIIADITHFPQITAHITHFSHIIADLIHFSYTADITKFSYITSDITSDQISPTSLRYITAKVFSKQTKKKFRFEPKQTETRSVSVVFRLCFGFFGETRNLKFWFVSVFRTYIRTTETNRTV